MTIRDVVARETLKGFRLPKIPVNGYELRYFVADGAYVNEVRLLYHVNSKWSDVSGDKGRGVDLVDQWQVITDGRFTGRINGWSTPVAAKIRNAFTSRTAAISAVKDRLERRAQGHEEQARELRARILEVL